jgi:hypothetical protein
MLHRFSDGGNVPSISKRALAGKNGSNGCVSMGFIIAKLQIFLYSVAFGRVFFVDNSLIIKKMRIIVWLSGIFLVTLQPKRTTLINNK